MRGGLEAVLQHLLPLQGEEGGEEGARGGPGASGHSGSSGGRAAADGQPGSPGSSSGSARGASAGSSSDDESDAAHPGGPASRSGGGAWQLSRARSTAAAAAEARSRRQRVLGSAEHLRALLAAAIATRDAARCDKLLAALAAPSLDVAAWLNSTANAALLVGSEWQGSFLACVQGLCLKHLLAHPVEVACVQGIVVEAPAGAPCGVNEGALMTSLPFAEVSATICYLRRCRLLRTTCLR